MSSKKPWIEASVEGALQGPCRMPCNETAKMAGILSAWDVR